MLSAAGQVALARPGSLLGFSRWPRGLLTAAAAPPVPGSPWGPGLEAPRPRHEGLRGALGFWGVPPGCPEGLGGPSWVSPGRGGALLSGGSLMGAFLPGGPPQTVPLSSVGWGDARRKGSRVSTGKRGFYLQVLCSACSSDAAAEWVSVGGIGCFAPRLRGGSEELQLDIKFQAGERRQRLKAGVMASSSPSLSFQLPGTKTPILRENSCQQIPKSPNSSPVSPAPAGRWLAKAARR